MIIQQARDTSPPKPAQEPFRRMRRPQERVQVLGGTMDLVKSAEVFHFVAGRISAHKRSIIANHNLHSLYLLQRDPELRAFFREADLVEVDSVPLILWARLVGRKSRRFHRCTYLDWRDEFWTTAERNGWRVFFLGGKPGVAERAGNKIRSQWPGVHLKTHHGYYDVTAGSEENSSVLAEINRFAPDVLLVGMGMPRQEAWVVRNYEALPNCVTFTVGGAFDYEAGEQLPCPRWVGQLGVEWLFRLLTNPKLFNRYVIEPWSLIPPAFGDVLRAISHRDQLMGDRPPYTYPR